MNAILTAILIGLVLGVLALGVYVAFRILNAPDMTIDGSFTLGAVSFTMISQTIIASGCNSFAGIIVGMVVAFIAGAIAGCFTGLLHTFLKVPVVLAGILTMTILYSINLVISNKRTSIYINNSIFDASRGKNIFIALLIVIVITALLILFFKTFLGRSIRATGDNEEMVKASSINSDLMKIIGLGLANALAGLAGSLYTQAVGFYDSTCGNGMMVLGVAGIIIGESLFIFVSLIFKKKSLTLMLIAAVVGSIIYRIIYALVLKFGIDSVYLKLLSAVIVIIAISIPHIFKAVKRNARA